MTRVGLAALLLPLLLAAGCGTSAGNTPTAGNTATTGNAASAAAGAGSDGTGKVCGEAEATLARYSTEAPERKALTKAINDSYQGKGDRAAVAAASQAYYRAWGRDLRALAEQARNAEVKAALTGQADFLDKLAATGDASQGGNVKELNDSWLAVKKACASAK
jgi:hypothetical protein